jgi:hypothetical protein
MSPRRGSHDQPSIDRRGPAADRVEPAHQPGVRRTDPGRLRVAAGRQLHRRPDRGPIPERRSHNGRTPPFIDRQPVQGFSALLAAGDDLDRESFRRDADGNFWCGDEVGPFLVHTNAAFEVIGAAIPTPGVQAPQNPFLGTSAPNLPTSRGFEGMAISPDGWTLYPMLEGTVDGDPAGTLRILKFDIRTRAYSSARWLYPLDPPGVAIGDFTQLNDTQFLVIERDKDQGAAARHKKVYLIDLTDLDANGRLRKTELVDLLAIKDPFDLNRDGDPTFRFPFVTIESVLPIDAHTLLIANDNNYPFSIGRGPDIDNNEFILVRIDPPLKLPVPLPPT